MSYFALKQLKVHNKLILVIFIFNNEIDLLYTTHR